MNAQELKTKPELKSLFNDFLNPSFIEPLEKLGFELIDYNEILHGDSIGTHALLFRLTRNPRKIILKELKDICKQDDDSQPCSTYRFYLGTLFLYIPYFA